MATRSRRRADTEPSVIYHAAGCLLMYRGRQVTVWADNDDINVIVRLEDLENFSRLCHQPVPRNHALVHCTGDRRATVVHLDRLEDFLTARRLRRG